MCYLDIFEENGNEALAWHGRGKIQCDTVPDRTIEELGDVIIKVTSCAICGWDLHFMGGFIPNMENGDILKCEASRIFC